MQDPQTDMSLMILGLAAAAAATLLTVIAALGDVHGLLIACECLLWNETQRAR